MMAYSLLASHSPYVRCTRLVRNAAKIPSTISCYCHIMADDKSLTMGCDPELWDPCLGMAFGQDAFPKHELINEGSKTHRVWCRPDRDKSLSR